MARDNDIELIKRIRSSLESNAQEILIKKYMPMVRYIVKNQNIPPVDFEDYFQEGMIGLLKAIMNFDLEQHANKFSTFAYVCILRRIFNIKKQVYRKRSLSSCSCFLQTTFLSDDSSNPLALIPDYHMEPFLQVEEKFIRQELDFILKAYLSPVEYYVVWLMISDYQLKEIREILNLPVKVIDNARTRARLKLKKVLFKYGSFLNPQIPIKTRKRKDRNMNIVPGFKF